MHMCAAPSCACKRRTGSACAPHRPTHPAPHRPIAPPAPPLVPLGRYNWSNNWQLWLNTSTALQQTLAVCLLTLARQRHNVYVENCMRSIFRQEAELEYRVRLLTGQAQPNPAVTVQSITQDGFARSLDWWVGCSCSWGSFSAAGCCLAWPDLPAQPALLGVLQLMWHAC